MINILPLTIESMVALLLLLTILYCVRLNSQLKRFKADGGTMQSTITELLAATESAERAIAGLRATVAEADATLGERLKAAEQFSAELHRHTSAGAELLGQLSSIGGAGGAEADEMDRPPPAKSIVVAAQAIAERMRARARSIAA